MNTNNEHEPEDDEVLYLRSLAGNMPIFIDEDKSQGGHFELFPEYED